MSKTFILGIVAAAVMVAILAAGGVFGYKLHSELSVYKSYGTPADLKATEKEVRALKQQLQQQKRDMNKLKKQFAVYRKQAVVAAEERTERRKATAVAAFTPLSGYYVIAATTVHEQNESCADIKALLAFEKGNFDIADPAAIKAQETVCNSYIDKKVEPVFKYQMLRLRANIKSSAGHLRSEAEDKFKQAKKLLKRWDVPVDRRLDKYLRF